MVHQGRISRSQGRTGGPGFREWRAGWPVVATSFLGIALVSIGTMSAGTFMEPLEGTFGWSRTEFSLGLTAYSLAGILLAPVVGLLVDKYGVRRVVVPGALLTGSVFSAFATLNGSLTQWLTLWLMLGVASQLVQFMVWMTAVTRRFSASRGLALAITMSGAGFASAVMPASANFMIEHFGWRLAFVVLGLGWGGVVGIASLLVLDDGGAKDRNESADIVEEDDGHAIFAALKSRVFLQLAVATFISFTFVIGLIVHMIPVLRAGGLERSTAVAIAGSYGVATVLGKIPIGLALDRYSTKSVAFVVWTVLLGSYGLFAVSDRSVLQYSLAAMLFGLSMSGMVTVISYFISRHFPVTLFGRLMGMIAGISSLAAAVGPVIWGWAYDSTGGYNALLIVAMPVIAASLLLILAVREQLD